MTCNCGCGGSLPCGCCEGVEMLTPATIGNRPGLNAIGYRIGTHGTFLETMKARLSGPPFLSLSGLKTRNSTDPAVALLDGWATVADVLTFYQERIANEGYLGTATERRSILELARLVGYRLRPGVAASVYLAYLLDKPIAIPPLIEKPSVVLEPPDPLITIPEGSRSQSVPGDGELPQSFETSDELVARWEWNNLQVRLTRPQRITSETRVIYLQGLPNLKPGDPLLIIASPPELYRVETVTPDPAAGRTKVTFALWLDPEATGPASAESLHQSVAKAVTRFSAAERFGVARSSRSAREVLALLGRLQRLEQGGGTAAELKEELEKNILPELRVLHTAAVSGRFTRVEPWVSGILDELESAARGRMSTSLFGASKPTATLIDLTAVLPALSRPRSIPPSDPTGLGRSLPTNLGSTSDIAPQLLTSLRPELETILYKAWENVPVTAAPVSEVHSFQVRASVFGHNAPLEPVRSDGVITGTKEWDLQLQPPNTTENFELTLREVTAGIFNTKITIGSHSTESIPVANSPIDFPAANEKVKVTTASANHKVTFDFAFAKRSFSVRVEVGPETQLAASSPSGPQVTVATPIRVNQDIVTAGTLTIKATAVTREEPQILWLDAPYNQILPGSWVALEKPSSLGATTPLVPVDSSLVIARATDVSERSRAEYGISVKSTRLRLNETWIDPTPGKDSMETVRGTSVFAASERLELAEEPIETPVSGNELELDGLYDGLESGRWLILSGERTDVVASPAQEAASTSDSGTEMEVASSPALEGRTEVVARPAEGNRRPIDLDTEIQVPGVRATELVMLAAVEQRYDPRRKGDKTHTFLKLSANLAYSYKRDTLIVYGNVVNATHGETRRETLGAGNASKPLQEFSLKQSPLTFVAASNPDGVESTLQVRVNDVLWHETDNLAELGPNDYRFVTQTDDADKTSVIFGTGEHGARLPTGPDNVTAVYRNGIGRSGNVKADQITLLASRPLGVKSVSNPMAATGGADRESRDQARGNAPLAVLALDRLVSTTDYADFARTFAGIAKASAARLSDGQRRLVHLTVAGSDDIPIDKTSDLYRNLNKALRDFGDPHQAIQVTLRTFLLLVIEARVRILPDYLFEKVEPKIRAALLDRFSFEQRQLGQDALLSDAMGTIQRVEGVAYVDVDKFDWVDEQKVVDHLAGKAFLSDVIGRRERIPVSLALVDTDEIDPSRRIKPAGIAYLSPDIPDTIILSEITS